LILSPQKSGQHVAWAVCC